MSVPVPTRVTATAYPRELISIENTMGGMSNYHMSAAWLWLGAWHVVAMVKCGDLTRAQELLSRMAAVIVRDKQIHEVYGVNGLPMSSWWYKSEAPLIWNAGMFIFACRHFEEANSTVGKLIHPKPAIP